MRAARGKLSRHADGAKAMDYMLKRWDAFTRFLGDGRICLTNNAAERALRGVANARFIVHLLFKYLETLEVDCRRRCDTGALYARPPPPRTAHPAPWRGSGTAHRERPARRAGCRL